MNKLVCVLPYCNSDHMAASRLLTWIKELDGVCRHHLLLAADDAVPLETKKAINELGKSVFESADTIMIKAPAPVNGNYHPAAAVMFERAMSHVAACYKWPWFWMEPDCVPLKAGWLDALSEGYENQPKQFMGSFYKPKQEGLPETIMYGTAVYPNGVHKDMKQFCDGKQAFDMAFSPYVVPRAANTDLIFHAFGAPGDAPTFKDLKMPNDGPNTGTLDVIPKSAVVMHRNKDGTLIELLRKQTPAPIGGVFRETENETMDRWATNLMPPSEVGVQPLPPKRRPGRPPKVHPEPQTA